eukprot:316394-Prorocentrum_minimum.AAC.1
MRVEPAISKGPEVLRHPRAVVDIRGDEPVEVDYDDPYLKLDFPSATRLPPPCISVQGAAFGYEEGRTLYRSTTPILRSCRGRFCPDLDTS